jgi:ricin-type beta-trefoil lectin protein
MGLLEKDPARRLTAERALRLLRGQPPKSTKVETVDEAELPPPGSGGRSNGGGRKTWSPPPLAEENRRRRSPKVWILPLVIALAVIFAESNWDTIRAWVESELNGGAADPGPITNTSTGLCVDTSRAGGYGFPMLVSDCRNYRSQDWSYDEDNDHLVNSVSGLCFDTATVPATGVNVVLNACGDYPAQQWQYHEDTGQFANPQSGLCLDTAGPPANQVSLVLDPCGNYTGQGWQM